MESKTNSKIQSKHKSESKLQTYKSISTMRNKGKNEQGKFEYERRQKKKKYKRKKKKLTQQQIQVFRQAFQIFDYNKSGSIDQEQLTSLMSALGYQCSSQKIKKILQQIDEDGSGVIQLDQFVQFMSKHMLDTDNLKKQIIKVFNFFDDDNSGYLDFRKVKTMVNQCFFNIDDQAIRNMIKVADIEEDGKISQYEFLRIMKKIKLL